MEHAAEDMNSLHYGAYQLSWKLLAWLALLRLLGIQRWITVSSSVARSDSEPGPQRQPEQESSSEELQKYAILSSTEARLHAKTSKDLLR